MENQIFTIESLDVQYQVKNTEEGNLIILTENNFEKLFNKLNQSQLQIEDLQAQLIEALKKQALIKNILNA
jgi:hypothetical protein